MDYDSYDALLHYVYQQVTVIIDVHILHSEHLQLDTR